MEGVEDQHSGRYNSSSFSVIGEDTVYRGNVDFEGVLHINGDFYGDITGKGDLGIGLTGRVRTVIHANNVLISGLVCGTVIATGRVGIKSSAIVIGDIQAASLVVEEGSILHGKLEILVSGEQKKFAKPGLFSYRKPDLSDNMTSEGKKTGEAAEVAPTKPAESQLAEGQGAALVLPGNGSENHGLTPSDPEASAEPGSESKKGKYSVWN